MPVLAPPRIKIATKKKRSNSPGEGKKPVICVFDPVAVHAVIFDSALAGLRDRADVHWQASFSHTSIENGGIDGKTDSDLIAAKKPTLLVSELEIIPDGGCHFGMKLMQNLRLVKSLKSTPLVVISNINYFQEVLQAELYNSFTDLRVDAVFFWGNLERKPDDQLRLFNFVAKILGLKREPFRDIVLE